MKKLFAVMLAVLMLLFTACAAHLSPAEQAETGFETGTETAAASEAGIHDPTGFAAGFGRGCMTPQESTPLAGYGNVDLRMSNRVLDDLYITCVAVSDGENCLLLFTLDVIQLSAGMQKQIASIAEKKLGVPADHVFCCATHTHSGPSITSAEPSVGSWLRLLYPAAEQAARDALADLDRTELYTGGVLTQDLNYVRRYINSDGTTSGDNYGDPSTRASHETEADREMQILRFDRVNQKDILLVNWQAHPTITGGFKKLDISADYVGAFRKEAEARLDCRFAFFQGASGNLNPRGTLAGETEWDVKTHGKKLCDALIEGLGTLTRAEPGAVCAAQTTVTVENDRVGSPAGDPEHEGEVMAAYNSGNIELAKRLCLLYGINSPYAISARGSRAARMPTEEMELGVASIGEIGFVFAPYEMFDSTGMFLKEQSPFARTVVCGQSLNYYGYMPTDAVWDNGGYEVDVTHFYRGTAEMLADQYLTLLNQIHGAQ